MCQEFPRESTWFDFPDGGTVIIFIQLHKEFPSTSYIDTAAVAAAAIDTTAITVTTRANTTDITTKGIFVGIVANTDT